MNQSLINWIGIRHPIKKKANARGRSICQGYAAYEDRKRNWQDSNPNATTAEFDQAMNRIARECGV